MENNSEENIFEHANSTREQLTSHELLRYNRQIILPGFGIDGQNKLKAAKVLVVGAGGLGSPLLLYLAAAGIGTIGVLDFDTIEESNLQRQVIFTTEDIGKSKAEVAAANLRKQNPYIEIRTHHVKLTSENALSIISQYDIIADGTDNFPVRYLISDACVLTNKVCIYASIFRFEGHISVFNYTDEKGNTGPNYRDLYPAPPAPESVPNCSEGGVIGVLPGIMGSLQANEILKLITGLGESLSGKLMIIDLLSLQSTIFKIKRSNPSVEIKSLIDYDEFCGIKSSDDKIKEISPGEFIEQWENNADIQVIDVREQSEYASYNIGARLIPLSQLMERVNEIRTNGKVVIHCHSGKRSIAAIKMLQNQFHFTNLYNLKGGIISLQFELEKIGRQVFIKP